jgi:hypothetical protein
MKFIAQASFNAMMFDLGEAPTREEAQKIIDEAKSEHTARFMFDGHYWINPGDDEAMGL